MNRYHGKCLKIARGKVKEDDKYTCPICDWRLKIPRDAARPKLEDLQNWYDELQSLPFQPEEEQTLQETIDTAQAFRDYIRPFVNPLTVTPEEVGTLRFYLRKVEGADILLGYETNFLRQELHKWAPVAPEAPPVIEYSSSTRKPRPTKQQKIMASLGITNPDDLPPEYKVKPSAKRKVTEALAMQRAQQPLQPAGGSPATIQSMQTPNGHGTPANRPPAGRTSIHQNMDLSTPSFSYDTQPRAMVTQAYRDSPLFAPSSSFSGHHSQHHPSGPPSHPQLGPPHVASSTPYGTPHTVNPAQFSANNEPTFSRPSPPAPPFNSGANLDPALFGGSGPSIFDKQSTGGVGSPQAYGSSHSNAGLDSLFADMVHEEGPPPSNHASEAFAASGNSNEDDGRLDEFINH